MTTRDPNFNDDSVQAAYAQGFKDGQDQARTFYERIIDGQQQTLNRLMAVVEASVGIRPANQNAKVPEPVKSPFQRMTTVPPRGFTETRPMPVAKMKDEGESDDPANTGS